MLVGTKLPIASGSVVTRAELVWTKDTRAVVEDCSAGAPVGFPVGLFVAISAQDTATCGRCVC